MRPPEIVSRGVKIRNFGIGSHTGNTLQTARSCGVRAGDPAGAVAQALCGRVRCFDQNLFYFGRL